LAFLASGFATRALPKSSGFQANLAVSLTINRVATTHSAVT
jgi:hypothetical protein